jgi:hypothetical protein
MWSDSCVANNDVGGSEGVVRVLHHSCHCIVLSDVGNIRHTTRSDRLDLFDGLLERGQISTSIHYDVRALARQFDRDSLADVAPSAGYDRCSAMLLERY